MATRGFGKVIVKDFGWDHIKSVSAELARKPAAVIGIRGAEAEAAKEIPGGTTSGATLVQIASVHEYGDDQLGIPERSFIRSTTDENLADYRAMLATLKDAVFNPKSGMTPRRALLLLGEKVKADIKAKIRAGIPPPWSDRTREERIRRAGGAIVAETPLIDTGQLINSVTNDVQYQKDE